MEPVTNGSSSGNTALPSSASAMPAPSKPATSITSSAAPIAPAPISMATRRPSFSTAAARSRSVGRQHPRRAVADTRMQGSMHVRGLRHGRHFLDIVRNDDARHGAHRLGDAEGAVGDVAHLRGAAYHLYIVARHVLKQRQQVDFLLIVASEGRQLLLSVVGVFV